MLRKPFFTVAFIGWMVFITFSSLYSFKGFKGSSDFIPHADKLVHFISYFVACVLGVFFIRELTRGSVRLKKAFVIMVVAMVVFGVIIEVIQHEFTLNREGDFFDALANSLGAISGAGVLNYVFSNRQALKWKI